MAVAQANGVKARGGVLMICPQFRPLIGGYERAAERLSAALVARGHAVTVVTERRDRRWARTEASAGVQIRRLPCLCKRGLHGPSSLVSLGVWLAIHGRAHAVWHVHQYGAQATLAVVLGRLLRRPVLVKLTSSGREGVAPTLDSLRASWFHRWAHRQMSGCVAVSDETAAEARAFGIPPERIHVIGNGVDTSAWRPASGQARAMARASLGCGDRFIAVAVGRLAAAKGPLGLIDAWRVALPTLPAGARLVWVGDGPMRHDVDARVRDLGLEGSIVLAGHSDEVPRWMAAADLFVLSSRNEGMANALLEAMSCGLPSVATEVSGVRELLLGTGAGLVVARDDWDGFADAMVVVALDSAKRHEMGVRARHVIVSTYSIDVVTDKVRAVYERAIAAAKDVGV